jgi:hypothetical protein
VSGLSPETHQLKKELKQLLPEQCRGCREANIAALGAAHVAVKKCVSPQVVAECFTENIGNTCKVGVTLENEGLCNERPVCNHPRAQELSAMNWGNAFSS